MRREQADHAAVAAACRATPGEWRPVSEYNSTQSAHRIVKNIREAYVRPSKVGTSSPYAPAGAFEATRILTEYGARVEARYMGSDDQAWADAITALTGGEDA
ncbi:hypothetical protein ACIGCZ_29365 [Streptomyces nigra]|uniref:hypothetical protein n=1 Tax=Streptomyces nigra TaxID=1827580 RepID=UPI0037D8FAEF